ncbi:MAG: hypothetical protein H6Q08_399 [Acidobacteria bacterium]|jgi:hypothetical protein|nr:hypothetical protein [Acidobacteriota bacterium]
MLAHQPDRYPLGAIRAGSRIMIEAAKYVIWDPGRRSSAKGRGPARGA